MADAGHVAWDMASYQWLLSGQDFPSIHPSLQRQAVLNMAYGLYEVVPGRIYQVRGYDLANISFIKGDTGWIIFDPLTAAETARAALEFINEKLGKRPVVGVVYSHTHVDHWAGVRGVVNEADVVSGKVMRWNEESDGTDGKKLIERIENLISKTQDMHWVEKLMQKTISKDNFINNPKALSMHFYR
jgi:alkyl sulfatase BDS1-like metallo-beta-lactamase superfamily hydrolase